MTFRATLFLAGKTATGIEVPAHIVESLGGGKKPAVRVTINGYTYRSTVAVMGGKFMLPVASEVRKGAGIAAGAEIEVTLARDTEPRMVEVPEDFQKALSADAKAQAAFEKLSYSNKRQHVLSIEGAKTTGTRERRIQKALEELGKAKQ